MRPISEIKEDLRILEVEYEANRNNLKNELAEFQSKCPHPIDFLTVNHIDHEDGGYGVERYDFSDTKVTCTMCEKVAWSGTYNKKHDRSSWTDWRPDPEKVIHETLDNLP